MYLSTFIKSFDFWYILLKTNSYILWIIDDILFIWISSNSNDLFSVNVIKEFNLSYNFSITYIGSFFAKIIIVVIIEYWEYKQYSVVLVKIISRYDFKNGIRYIFKLLLNKLISFSVKDMKYSFKKLRVLLKRYKSLSKIILLFFLIWIFFSSFINFSIKDFTFSKIIWISSEIPSVWIRALNGEYNSFLLKSFNTNKL